MYNRSPGICATQLTGGLSLKMLKYFQVMLKIFAFSLVEEIWELVYANMFSRSNPVSWQRQQSDVTLLNRVPCVTACQCGLRENVHAYQCGLRTNMLRANVPKACQLFIFTYQHANKRANVLYGVAMFQLGVPNGVPVFQTFLSQNVKANFYTLFLYKNTDFI